MVELAHGHDGEAEDVAGCVHALHDRVLVGFSQITGRIGEAHFEEVAFTVEPDFYGLGHS